MTLLYNLQIFSLLYLSIQDFRMNKVSGYAVSFFAITSLSIIGNQVSTTWPHIFSDYTTHFIVLILCLGVVYIMTHIQKKSVIGSVDYVVIVFLLMCLSTDMISLFLISTGCSALLLHGLIKKEKIPLMPCLTFGYGMTIFMNHISAIDRV